MNQLEGKWKQFTGTARERWGKLTDSGCPEFMTWPSAAYSRWLGQYCSLTERHALGLKHLGVLRLFGQRFRRISLLFNLEAGENAIAGFLYQIVHYGRQPVFGFVLIGNCALA